MKPFAVIVLTVKLTLATRNTVVVAERLNLTGPVVELMLIAARLEPGI